EKKQKKTKIEEIITGKESVSSLIKVEVKDLLGREPVQLDTEKIESTNQNETIMVTGAGGSIGSEIVRQLTKFKPKRLVLVGHGEYSIYEIHRELKDLKNIEIV